MDEVNISIIMPVYNAEKYLGETLQSLLKLVLSGHWKTSFFTVTV